MHPEEEGTAARDDYAPLVRAAAAGSRPAMERLLMRSQEVAWRFSMAVCGGPDDAEDVMQEALLKTYEHVSRVREPEAFRAWLYRTVRNACLMRRRLRAGEPRVLQPLDDPSSPDGDALKLSDPSQDPEAATERGRLRDRLRRALASLPMSYRIVVVLRDIEGLSTREVSSVLKTSEANVKTRLHRARTQLRKALES